MDIHSLSEGRVKNNHNNHNNSTATPQQQQQQQDIRALCRAILGQQLHPSRARALHHGCRINETAYLLHLSKATVLPAGSSSGSGVESPAENFLRAGGADGLTGWGGVAVAAGRGFVLQFNDVAVVDVPVVQVVDVGSSSSWTWLSSCPLLCK